MTSRTTSTTLVSDGVHVELTRLVIELTFRIDAGLASTAHELFTPDAELRIGPEPVVGSDAIKAWGEQLDQGNQYPGIRHAVTNLRFVDEGNGRSSGTSLVTAYFVAPGDPATTAPFAIGEDRDTFVRTDGGWRFASRTWVQLFTR
ncbi:nuclear transport factor 2 family protein [Micromonospora sp. NPDC049645]|uniref:nuclear transport factor 2 family protein n=1 Tax=Micromonospora sp. NPDC049645 TaxID=3155508 RepID=UPI00341D9D3F